jgi:hypothetical protein
VTDRAKLCAGEAAAVVKSFLNYAYTLWHGRSVAAYDECVFRHLVAVERSRGGNPQGTALIVFVSLESSDVQATAGATMPIPPPVARQMFVGLARSLREVDFIGWYREGRVAGAVLAQGPILTPDVRLRVQHRVTQELYRCLPPRLQQVLQVRVESLQQAATVSMS